MKLSLQENRPFFTEGTELFNKAGLFYSRRVGEIRREIQTVQNLLKTIPILRSLKNPAGHNLYNAIKFSGRTKKKLGLGFFNAIAQKKKQLLEIRQLDKDTDCNRTPR